MSKIFSARSLVPVFCGHLSTLQDCERRFFVYTPPGYNSRRREKYPVLVLLPGTPGNESDWINVGLAHRIFDNLLADRKLVEMVALMPPSDVLRKGGTRADNLKEFEPLLLKEILPLFEQRYHVHRRPEARAIAGLSLRAKLNDWRTKCFKTCATAREC